MRYFGILFALALLLPLPAHADETASAYAGNIEGTVELTRAGSTRVLREGEPLRAGDRILTGDDASAEVVFADGSVLEAGEKTRLVIRHVSSPRGVLKFRADLERGFLSNTVVPVSGLEYRVTTPTGSAGVRGTEFDLAHEEGSATTDLAVDEGSVEVTDGAEARPQTLRAGAGGRFGSGRFYRNMEVRQRLANRREEVRNRVRRSIERRFSSRIEAGEAPGVDEIYRDIPPEVRARMSPKVRERIRTHFERRVREFRERRTSTQRDLSPRERRTELQRHRPGRLPPK